jgi:hypothetical protein
LLIIAAAVLVVAIVIIAVTNVLSVGQTQTTGSEEDEFSAITGLEEIFATKRGNELIRRGTLFTLMYTGTNPQSVLEIIEYDLPEDTIITVNGVPAQPTTSVTQNQLITIQHDNVNITIPGNIPDSKILRFVFREPTNTGKIGKVLVRPNGDAINASNLEEAYTAGDIVIYKGVNEISTVQKAGTEKYLVDITGCYGGTTGVGYNSDMLIYNGSLSQNTFTNKFGKIVSVNNNPAFSNYLDTIHQLVGPTYTSRCCGACGSKKCINLSPSTFTLTKSQCPYPSWPSGGTATNSWEIEVYNYSIIDGTTSETGKVGIDPLTGTITNLDFTQVSTCSYSSRYCCENDTDCDLFAVTWGTPLCIGSETTYCYVDARDSEQYPNGCADMDCIEPTCQSTYLSSPYQDIGNCTGIDETAIFVSYSYWEE